MSTFRALDKELFETHWETVDMSGADYWNRKYDRARYVYGTEPSRFLVDHARSTLSGLRRILCIGAGEGRNAVWLAEHGFEPMAIDSSSRALQKLRGLARRRGVDVQTRCIDIVDFQPKHQAWDAVTLLHLHLPPATRRRVHRQITASLGPGGVLLLEALRPAQLHQPTRHSGTPDHLYTSQQLRCDFQHLDIIDCRELERHIDAGEHRGMTSVVELVARKR